MGRDISTATLEFCDLGIEKWYNIFMEKISQKDGMQMTGKVTIKCYKAGTAVMAQEVAEKIKIYKKFLNDVGSSIRAELRTETENRIDDLKHVMNTILKRGYIRTALVQKNLIVCSPGYGKDIIIQRLIGVNTCSLNISWVEVGTGATTPTVSDVALTTPAYRFAPSFVEDFGNNEAIIQIFMTDAQMANGTYYEVGAFCDGTSSFGTGYMFNHALFSSPYTKVSGQDTTVEIDFAVA